MSGSSKITPGYSPKTKFEANVIEGSIFHPLGGLLRL